jgi:hypothetical protein
LRQQGFALDPEIDNKSNVDFNQYFGALAKYGSKVDWQPDEGVLNEAIKVAYRVFGGNQSLHPLMEKEEIYQALKLEKSSGAPSFTTKGDAFETDFKRSERIAKGDKAPEPCVGYRRIQHGNDSSGPKTRLVWGYPLSMTILEAKYARPLIDEYLSQRSVMAFGLHRHELASRLVRIENANLKYSLDFSSFDSSIHPRLIDVAFKVLKTNFDPELVNKGEWDSIVHYFIHTPIVMPDGLLYKKHQGVPSGSYFTQLVDSIVNFITLQYMSFKSTSRPIREDKVLVLGDDSVFSFDKHLPLELIAKVIGELGIKVNAQKSRIVKGMKQSLEFLGHVWVKGLVNREEIEIAKRMAFPERHIQIDDPRKRIVTRVLAYGSDALNAHLIINRWSIYKGPNVMGMYFRDVLSHPVTGWQEFVQSESGFSAYPKTALDQSYKGILV